MSHLLLFADDRVFAALKQCQEIPDDLLLDGEAAAVTTDFESGHLPFVRRHPELLYPLRTSGGQSGTQTIRRFQDYEQREFFFAELLNSTVFHICVIENQSRSVGADTDRSSVTLQGRSNLPELAEWYGRFRKEAKDKAGHRGNEYKHILILVFADDIPAAEIEPLQKLLGKGQSAPETRLDACYVMMRRIEHGGQDVLHSRYVWPTLVSRLLICLLANRKAHREQETRVQAWRAFDFLPNVPPAVLEEAVKDQLLECFNRLQESFKVKVAVTEKHFDPASVALNLQEVMSPSLPEAQAWPFEDPMTLHAAASDGSRWEPELRTKGRSYARDMRAVTLDQDLNILPAVIRLWQGVHAGIDAIGPNLNAIISFLAGRKTNEDSKRLAASDQDRSWFHRYFTEAKGFWSQMLECSRRREVGLHLLKECVPVLDEARAGYVAILPRLIFGAASSLLITYAVASIFQGLYEHWLLWAATAGTIFSLITLLIAFLIRELERRRGQKAMNRFREGLTAVDALVGERHRLGQECLRAAVGCWEQHRIHATGHRLRVLLQRVQRILQRELEPGAPSSVSIREQQEQPAQDSSAEDLRKKEEEILRRHLTKILEASWTLHDGASAQLKEATDQAIQQFKTQWTDYCETYDQQSCCGHLPAHVLIPWIRTFVAKFRRAIFQRLNKDTVAVAMKQDPEAFARGLEAIENQEQFHYMSCPFYGSRRKRLEKHLYIRPELKRFVAGRQAEEHPCLEHFPAAAYLFEEVPIDFCVRETSDGQRLIDVRLEDDH